MASDSISVFIIKIANHLFIDADMQIVMLDTIFIHLINPFRSPQLAQL